MIEPDIVITLDEVAAPKIPLSNTIEFFLWCHLKGLVCLLFQDTSTLFVVSCLCCTRHV
jgi:hypothetical protein